MREKIGDIGALYAERLFLLDNGKLVAQGSAKAVLSTDILTKWYRADLSVGNHLGHHQLPHIFLNQ